jgi:hypothetical protein
LISDYGYLREKYYDILLLGGGINMQEIEPRNKSFKERLKELIGLKGKKAENE